MLLSAIVAGELIFDFRNGSRCQANMREFSEFLDNRSVSLLPVSLVTPLRKKGKALPTNDIWITAHTMESGAELLSSDRRFE